MLSHSIKYGNNDISFTLEFSDRKTLGIYVHPDTCIHVRAPLNSGLQKIKEKVKSKAAWILKQQHHFRQLKPYTPARKYINGESHLYLGRQYRLKIVLSDKDEVKLSGGAMMVFVLKKDKDYIKRVLHQWYVERAHLHIIPLFNEVFSLVRFHAKLEDVSPELKIKVMEKRWGSCTPSGKIILNTDLIRASKFCIEYVIMHELCHLIHHNHSSKFYKLLSTLMPDWERRKDHLERLLS